MSPSLTRKKRKIEGFKLKQVISLYERKCRMYKNTLKIKNKSVQCLIYIISTCDIGYKITCENKIAPGK